MVDSMVVEILVNLLQFTATLLIAMEYYLSPKILKKMRAFYYKGYQEIYQGSTAKVTRLHKNFSWKNYLKFIGSLISLFILMFCTYYLLHSGINMFFLFLIYTIFLVIHMYFIIKYFIISHEFLVEKINHKIIYDWIGNQIVFAAKKNPLVGLGVLLFSISFLLNIMIILAWNNTLLMLIVYFLLLIVLVFLEILYRAYQNVRV
jgi:hypothetical protein